MRILEVLPMGKENAIPSRELADLCGYKHIRELQKDIETLRINGEVIASTCQNGGGYFRPANESELREYISTVESRAKNSFRSLKSARRALRDLEKNDA